MDEDVLIDNAKEYWANDLAAEEREQYNTSVTLFFKTLSALADLYVLRKEGNTPTSHTNRFRLLERRYPDIYDVLDKDFPFYQDSYRAKLSKEINEILKEDAKRLFEKLKIEM